MNHKNNKLKFWGVRGSIPTGEPDQMETGGDTSCVEFAPEDGTHIIFDAGTGIRIPSNHIARSHDSEYEVHLFLSHTHWDHIIGLPFFAPMHQRFATVNIYGPKRAAAPLGDVIWGLFKSPYFPLERKDIKAKVNFIELKNGEMAFANGHVVKYAPHPHPNGALTYRIESPGSIITYVTDIEHTVDHLVPSVLELSQDADALIHDSHFHREDLPTHRTWGHSSWEESTAIAKQCHVKNLYLFHFSPNYNDYDIADMERRAQEVFPSTTAAYQGLTVDIPAK